MQEICARKNVLPPKVLCSAVISERRAKEIDLSLLSYILNSESCLQYNGYNTKITREEGMSIGSKTQAASLPLIDMLPSNSDTIMTALMRQSDILKIKYRKAQFSPAISSCVELLLV